jgi:hypothetical protein
MRLLTAHEAKHRRFAQPARCYSLELPSWAAPRAAGPAFAARAARKPGLARQVLRHMGSHPTGIER